MAKYPPSISKLVPDTNELSSLARKIKPLAISSDLPKRFIGCKSMICCFTSSWSLIPPLVNNGVSIKPGQMALIRIPSVAYSKAAVWVSPITPCFAAT